MGRIEVICYGDLLCKILLTEQLRRVFAKTHESASVHLPIDPFCTRSLLLDSWHGIVGLVADVDSWILLMSSNACQETSLLFKLLRQVFEGTIKLLKLIVQVVPLTNQLLGLTVPQSH